MLLDPTVDLSFVELHVVLEDLLRHRKGSVFVEIEVTRCIAAGVLGLEGVGLDKVVHQSVVSHFGEPLWNFSLVTTLGTGIMEVWVEVLELVHVEFSVGIELHKSPVVVEVTAEGGVWVGVPWNWTSDVWLRILVQLSQSPIVMKMA